MLTFAIIGAPNVGKSTFFNKTIGGRRSIVEDKPGVTRDKVYARVNLNKYLDTNKDYSIEVIDTGGLFFKDDSLFLGIQKQTFSALEEADCILFMVDARAGINKIDKLIADYLHKNVKDKPIVVLANKVDSVDLDYLINDFYNLGLGDPLPWSNIGGGFKQSIRNLIEHLEDRDFFEGKLQDKPHKMDLDMPKLVLLGKPNTGKSSITNALAGYERSLVHDVAGTTRDALDTYLLYKDQDILLIDTAGLRRKSKVYEELERYSIDRSIKGMVRADIVVLVIDVTEGISHQDERLASLVQKRYKGCIIVLNKWDLIPEEEKDYELTVKKIQHELKFIDYAPVVVTSAVKKQRLNNILDKAIEIHANLHKQIKTNILNQVLREIVALKYTNSKLKIYYITQTGVNPVAFILFVNDPKHLSPNYLLFLERNFRAELGFEGVPIKWDIRKSVNKPRKY